MVDMLFQRYRSAIDRLVVDVAALAAAASSAGR